MKRSFLRRDLRYTTLDESYFDSVLFVLWCVRFIVLDEGLAVTECCVHENAVDVSLVPTFSLVDLLTCIRLF